MTTVRPARTTTHRVAPTLGVALMAAVLSGCATPNHGTPRLAVVIVVDMFPADLLERYDGLFSENGFKRLTREGADFTNARFNSAITVTGPGHATIATGTYPAAHGVVANYWYEPDTETVIDCVRDPETTLIGSSFAGDISGCSAHRLVGATIGDQLKSKHGPSAKVWSCALKDRAAVLAAGHDPDGVVWWSPETGDFISSTNYFNELPDWCRRFNESRYADTFFNTDWDHLLPIERYAPCDDDLAPYENATRLLWVNTLPKNLGKPMFGPNRLYYERLRASPFGNDLVFEFAKHAVINESLGADDVPDLLFLGLSSHDYAGHLFGPRSHEIADMFARTDRRLADWLDFLDQHVGLDHCIVTLTGDHGAGLPPEYAQKQGLDAGRIDLNDLFAELNNALREEFGTADDGLNYIRAVNLPWVYLNASVLAEKGIDPNTAAARVADAADRYPGVDAAFTPDQIENPDDGAFTHLKQAIARAAYPDRSGQVYVHVKPHWQVARICCDHRTAHPYDTRVPLVFMGDAFKPGRYDDPVDISDLAVTLSAALGIDPPPAATGRVLTQAMTPRP